MCLAKARVAEAAIIMVGCVRGTSRVSWYCTCAFQPVVSSIHSRIHCTAGQGCRFLSAKTYNMKQRFNAFGQIHKALRAMLYDTALQLQLTDYDQQEEALHSLDKLAELLFVFERHAHHEDHFILPALGDQHKALVREFEAEHDKDEWLTGMLTTLIEKYREEQPALRQQTGTAIQLRFQEFVAFNLYHMNKEEEMINPILWELYTDEGIMAIQKAILAQIPVEESKLTSRWMLRGMPEAEITRWLLGIKNSAPEAVFQGMLTMAKAELSSSRWNKLQASLSEGVLLA